MLLDILFNTEYLNKWLCWKLAERGVCACWLHVGCWSVELSCPSWV